MKSEDFPLVSMVPTTRRKSISMFKSEADILREVSEHQVKRQREEEQRRLLLSRFGEKFIIKQSNLGLQLWLTLQTILNFGSSVSYAQAAAFFPSYSATEIEWFRTWDSVLEWIFFTDLVLLFFVEEIVNTVAVKDLRELFKIRVRQMRFWVALLTIIPFSRWFEAQISKEVFGLLYIIKAARFLKAMELLDTKAFSRTIKNFQTLRTQHIINESKKKALS
mmetsp:Transcript_25178/g.38999  ORF Transcript_25178/g.38999 Transcript_25178/m.38999 type:complete len:221 (+) Transcript_25178:826-1488(+)